MRMVGAFESTFQPAHDVDVLESTGHVDRFHADLDLLGELGISRLRYPVRWHRIEREPGVLDWSDTDVVLGELHDRGFEVIVDLVHHTSYPAWLTEGFADARFPSAYLRYCEAFARRYPETGAYTLFNEPFATLFLCGDQGLWPPYHHGLHAFVALMNRVLPAIAQASAMYADLLPDAHHVYTDSCEHATGDARTRALVRTVNDRRFFVLDALLGRLADDGTDHNAERPYVQKALAAGAEPLLGLEPIRIDVLGLDYYAHSQWHYTRRAATTPSPQPIALHELILQYWDRYGLPLMLSETNIRGHSSDRASWLKHTLEQCELARIAGADLRDYCWFPFVDSCDWDTLLFHARGSIDPVGVYRIDDGRDRHPSSMVESYALAARGTPAAALPAYRFRAPVSRWMAGFLPHMAHWDWRDAPAHEATDELDPEAIFELRICDAAS